MPDVGRGVIIYITSPSNHLFEALKKKYPSLSPTLRYSDLFRLEVGLGIFFSYGYSSDSNIPSGLKVNSTGFETHLPYIMCDLRKDT